MLFRITLNFTDLMFRNRNTSGEQTASLEIFLAVRQLKSGRKSAATPQLSERTCCIHNPSKWLRRREDSNTAEMCATSPLYQYLTDYWSENKRDDVKCQFQNKCGFIKNKYSPSSLSQIAAVRLCVCVCVCVSVSRWAQCVCPERSALSSLAPLVSLKSITERNEHSPNIWLSMFSSSFLSLLFSQESKFTLLWLCEGVNKYFITAKYVQTSLFVFMAHLKNKGWLWILSYQRQNKLGQV